MCRRRVGILDGDILDTIGKMDVHEQAKANATLAAYEAEVRRGSFTLARILPVRG